MERIQKKTFKVNMGGSMISTFEQCFGSIFIESGSSQKSESGSKLFLNTTGI